MYNGHTKKTPKNESWRANRRHLPDCECEHCVVAAVCEFCFKARDKRVSCTCPAVNATQEVES